jgi:lysine-N-methylase
MQNWSCHSCGGCCREHEIGITDDEKKRIENLQWEAADGVPTDRPVVVRLGSGWRLNHRDDGACVFLNSDGRCRIHAKFGELTKPLACLAYPYAIHPAGKSVTTSLRFSCPSVVQNLGLPLTQQRSEIEAIVRRVVPKDYTQPEAPHLTTRIPLSWPIFMQIQAYIERGLADAHVSFAVRLIRVLSWLDLLEKVEIEILQSDALGSLLAALHEASLRAYPDNSMPVVRPGRMARLMFRQLIAQLLRHDTSVTAQKGLAARMQLLAHGLRFTLGVGAVPTSPDPPSVQTAFGLPGTENQSGRSVSFTAMEAPAEGRTTEIDLLMTRYFQVKVQGIHFCGRAYYDMPLIDGFRALALMYPATLWVARLRVVREGRNQILLRDVQAALATLDHNFGYSPALGLRSSRQRISQLAAMQQISALCNWYSV